MVTGRAGNSCAAAGSTTVARTASASAGPSARKNESIRLFLRGSPWSFANGRRRRADLPQGALSDKAEPKKSHRGAAARAANANSRRGNAAAAASFVRGLRFADVDREEASVLGRPGSDLLFQVLRLSTIGAGKFYGRVRDGIGYRLPANTTRPAKDG